MNTQAHRFGTFLPLLLLLTSGIPGLVGQTYTPFYSFNNSSNSPDPLSFVNPGTLAQGQDGSIYASSENGGGPLNSGAFFSLSATNPLPVPNVVYSFDPSQDKGCSGPVSGVTLGTDGNFYGALGSCLLGSGSGYVYKITSGGVLDLMYNFTGAGDGGQPQVAPVEGRDGNFYGTTLVDGGPANCGTIYRITPTGSVTTLHQFDHTHGCGSYAPLVLGTDGNFYGVASSGGTAANSGVIFRMTTAGQYSVLYTFPADGSSGLNPIGPLVQGIDGKFYGTARGGGIGNNASGVIFQLSSGKLKILHTFTGAPDGSGPVAGLVQATDGNFYGVTEAGGNSMNCSGGCGTIFRINSTGTSYSVPYNFDSTTGSIPEISLLQHTNGVLHGLTFGGGTYNAGVFFSVNAGLKPFAGLVSSSGTVGNTIGILGQGFTGTTAVTFSGVAASYTVVSDTYVTATVPSGAKTGLIAVTSPSGTLKSYRKFQVLPAILSFSPPSGPVGASVVITGSGLIQTTRVTFGGVAATQITVNSDMQVTAIVPTGAKTGKIGIVTPGGTATSSSTFTVTPSLRSASLI